MYVYRCLPCNVVPKDKLWAVSGKDIQDGSGGVLEWCRDEADANNVLRKMKKYPNRFKNLTMYRWSCGRGVTR